VSKKYTNSGSINVVIVSKTIIQHSQVNNFSTQFPWFSSRLVQHCTSFSTATEKHFFDCKPRTHCLFHLTAAGKVTASLSIS